MTSADPTPVLVDADWHANALATSVWLHADPQLEVFARRLAADNVAVRADAVRRSGELCAASGTAHVLRAAEVSFEVFIQSLALLLDLRDAARASGVPVRRWATEQRRRLASLPDRMVRRSIEDVLDEGTPGDAAAAAESLDPLGDAGLARLGVSGTDPLHAALARRLRITTESLGPTFVKFGQLIGSAEGLLPPGVVAEFARCHDTVRPVPSAAIVAAVETALGPLDEVFSSFDPKPLAAASIAQVHAAVLRDGREVVVKVQRPDVRTRIERDIAVLARLARTSSGVELMSTLNLEGMIELFAATVVEELDFRLEAENMIDVGLCIEHAGIDDVVVPRPVPGLVTPTVLVMERLHGSRMREETTASRSERLALLRVGTQAVIEGALTYGLFHGDMHAGNMLLLDDGRYGLLDFGIVGRFDHAQRWALMRWLVSFSSDDLSLQMRALADLGAFPPDTDLEEVTGKVDVVLAKIASDDAHAVDEVTRNFELIARILVHHGMRLPKELSLFFKNLVHVSGAIRTLDPEGTETLDVNGMLDGARASYRSTVDGTEPSGGPDVR